MINVNNYIKLLVVKDVNILIKVEGYKAFHGSMKIEYKLKGPEIIEDKDWLYKPDTDCWYGAGKSFPANICTIIKEETND